MSAKYKVNLSLADQIRLEKLASDLGIGKGDSVAVLIRDFFAGQGVKNPSKKRKSS